MYKVAVATETAFVLRGAGLPPVRIEG